MWILGLVHTGDKIDFDSVDFVEADWIDQTVDEIDRAVDFVTSVYGSVDWVASSLNIN